MTGASENFFESMAFRTQENALLESGTNITLKCQINGGPEKQWGRKNFRNLVSGEGGQNLRNDFKMIIQGRKGL